MARKKDLSGFSTEELVAELGRRVVDEKGGQPTLTEMELGWEDLVLGGRDAPPIAAMLSRMKPEKPSPKACPRCGGRTPVKARDRERTVQSLAGTVTYKRNYHYCMECSYGFYPVDRLLGVPEEGEVSEELEKRILDFGVNDTFDEAADRWNMHYRGIPISSNLVRRVVDRVGAYLGSRDARQLELNLKPPKKDSNELVIVETDGSMLPMRGKETWKEAKVCVITRASSRSRKRRRRGVDARYVAVLGPQPEFTKAVENALEVEEVHRAKNVVWIGDGAAGNWLLCGTLCPQATQILDWYHAVEHMMEVGRQIFGEGSLLMPLWKRRAEQLLGEGDMNRLVVELMDCTLEAEDRDLGVFDDLVRYVRQNQARMNYLAYRASGFPIGSGVAESAHRHVLQIRMKRAGQRWSIERARRMTRLRAAYRTSGPRDFHRAIRTAPARSAEVPRKKHIASNR